MQTTPPVINLPQADQPTVSLEIIDPSERLGTVWVSRCTGLIGGSALFSALCIWLIRPNHYRLVLLLLVIAMFMAILHSYTFENGLG